MHGEDWVLVACPGAANGKYCFYVVPSIRRPRCEHCRLELHRGRLRVQGVTHRGGAIRFSATVNRAITLLRTCFDACVTDGGGFDPETSRSDGGAVFFAQTSTALANIRENLCYGCEAGYEG